VQPLRVILDSQLNTPPDAQLVNTSPDAQLVKLNGRTIILTCANDAQKQQRLQHAGFEIYHLPAKNNRLDLNAVMPFLAQELHINDVLVEAGAILNGALLEENLVDEWLIYMATCVLGDQGKGLFALPNLQSMNDKKTLHLKNVQHVGNDLKLTLTPITK
jgi:diaminohydroxyphosphoribosylaminopyrimidine deaminase/5-amino-6-(5-phosphoribosylamino)uracil reductase